jgi:hypothetical protein
MKKNYLVILVLAIALFCSNESYSQKKFTIVNESGFLLYGLMLKQNNESNMWSKDLMTESEFPSGTSFSVTIPVGYTCNTHMKVTYQVNGRIIEEILGWTNSCTYSGIKILKNKKGTSGNWMTFVNLP